MPVETVTFTHDVDPQDVGTHRVYLRTSWADAWVEVEHLHCTQARWAMGPSMPTATLRWRYGVGMRQLEETFGDVDLQSGKLRAFVKIEFAVGALLADINTWYGVIDAEGHKIFGTKFSANPAVSRGIQQFSAFGLEHLLAIHRIDSSVWENDIFASREIDRPLQFNSLVNNDVIGNRGHALNGASFLFDGRVYNVNDTETRFTWSTREIIAYLLTHQTPKNSFPLVTIPFALEDLDNILPRNDAPVVAQIGKSTLDIIASLTTRHRGIGYYFGVDGQTIKLYPVSFASANLILPNGDVLPENTRQRRFVFDESANVSVHYQEASIDAVDQAIARGARQRTCFSISMEDETFVPGWSTALQDEYNAGASDDADYPADAEIAARQRRNALARSQEHLEDVYSRFTLPHDWDYTAGDGVGGIKRHVFYDDANFEHNPYPPEIRILGTLPLLSNHDYEGTNIENGMVTHNTPGPWHELPPLVIAPLPEDDAFYAQLDQIGLSKPQEDPQGSDTDRTWSAHVRAITNDRALRIRVSGHEQHVIALQSFDPVDSSDVEIHKWDYNEFICTIAVEDDTYCQVKWPLDLPVRDDIRKLLIDAGDDYKLDYVVPTTIVGVATDGTFIRSTGGLVRDDRNKLENVARLAFEWYSTSRQTVEVASTLFHAFDAVGGARIGDLLIAIGDTAEAGDHQKADINAVISEIEWSSQPSSPGAIRAPMVRYSTGYAELDPLRL